MNARHHVFLSATLAAGVALGALSLAHAQSGGAPTNPGFNAKDKINPGETLQVPSAAPPGANDASGTGNTVTNRAPPLDKTAATNEPIPSTAELRAAMLSPDSPDPAIGQVAMPAPNGGEGNAANNSSGASGDPTTSTQGHAAIGGPLSPGAGKDGGSSGSGGGSADKGAQGGAQGGAQAGAQGGQETNGSSPAEQKALEAARQTSPNKPIGSTTQTLPAKFSARNATIDLAPMMALPFRLKDDQLRQIYQAAMSDKDATAIDGAGLKPASELTTAQAEAMRPLPGGVAAQIKALKYLKTKDKVLLVEPSTRIVLDEISG